MFGCELRARNLLVDTANGPETIPPAKRRHHNLAIPLIYAKYSKVLLKSVGATENMLDCIAAIIHQIFTQKFTKFNQAVKEIYILTNYG